eukprot:3581973-Rhodomonas_salina.1
MRSFLASGGPRSTLVLMVSDGIFALAGRRSRPSVLVAISGSALVYPERLQHSNGVKREIRTIREWLLGCRIVWLQLRHYGATHSRYGRHRWLLRSFFCAAKANSHQLSNGAQAHAIARCLSPC